MDPTTPITSLQPLKPIYAIKLDVFEGPLDLAAPSNPTE